MKKLAILLFLVSFQAFGYNTDKVDIDIIQAEKGKVFGKQTMIVYYGKCQSERTFEWAEMQAYNEGKPSTIKDWVFESIDQMSEKCD
jgi:hypothetical protein